MPGMLLWGSPQQGCCGLGSMDGSTPTPQGHTRYPQRANTTKRTKTPKFDEQQ